MKHFLFTLAFIFSFAEAFTSCQSGYDLGEDWVSSSFKNVYTDTCAVNISTVFADSLETLGDSCCQIGYHADATWGKIRSSYIAEFSKSTFSPDDNYSYEFDSVTIRMTPSGEYWGDTLATQKIDVYRLTEPITIDENKSLYNHTQVAVSPTSFASFSFLPRPGRKEVVEARLPDSFGKQIFQDILDEKDYFNDQSYFREYFPGLAFKSSSMNSFISGFAVSDSSMVFSIYYHKVGNDYD